MGAIIGIATLGLAAFAGIALATRDAPIPQPTQLATAPAAAPAPRRIPSAPSVAYAPSSTPSMPVVAPPQPQAIAVTAPSDATIAQPAIEPQNEGYSRYGHGSGRGR